MRMKYAWLAMIINVGIVFAAPAQKTAPAALAGRVSSDAEGPMEGVLVRAKGEGKTIRRRRSYRSRGALLFSGEQARSGQIQH